MGTTEAFKTRSRGNNPSDESVGVRVLYHACTQKEKIQKLYDDVKNGFDGRAESEYAKRPLSTILGNLRVDSMIRTVPSSEATRFQTKIKNFMERLNGDKKLDRETKPNTFVKSDDAFAAKRFEKYDILRLWNSDLDNVEESKQHSEFILDPNELHGVLHEIPVPWKRKQYNLGWARFRYKGTPYLAEVALGTIEEGEQLFTCYAEKLVVSTDMKYNDEQKEIVRNVENKVKEMLQKMSNAK